MADIFIKMGKFGQKDIHTGEAIWRHTGRRQPCDRSDAFRSQNLIRNDSKHQKLEEARRDSPLKPLERAWPC